MISNSNANLPIIPAKRYFNLQELCELVQINPVQFQEWQNAHGIVIGYGGQYYTRQEVVKLRKLKETFSPFIDEFNHNAQDAEGNPAATAAEISLGLQKILDKIEKMLANKGKN